MQPTFLSIARRTTSSHRVTLARKAPPRHAGRSSKPDRRWDHHAFAPLLIALFVFLAPILSGQALTAPTIASLSSSQTVTQGVPTTLSVTVNGTAPFTYQWYKNAVAIPDATSAELVFAAVSLPDDASYTVVVKNTSGSVTGGPILLAVKPATAPVISESPASTSVAVGEPLTLSVSTSGSAPLTFVWKQGTTTLATYTSTTTSATTTNTHSIPSVTQADAGSYSVTVSNAAGSRTSAAAVVTVTAPVAPTIASSPKSQAVVPGSSFSLYVSVSGTAPLTYQWFKDGTAIALATDYVYTKTAYTTADAGAYTVVVSNAVGSATSQAAIITSGTPPPAAERPKITSHPASATLETGDELHLYVNATSSGQMTYQWNFDNQPIANATDYYYSASGITTARAGAYTVTVSNTGGSITSNPAIITVRRPEAPTIVGLSPAQNLSLGSRLSIAPEITGAPPLTYQWKKDGVVLASASSAAYSIPNIQPNDGGSYTLTVTNAYGSTTSEPVVVSVMQPQAPTFRTQPKSQTWEVDDSISLTATADGQPSPSYQWYKNGTAIPGATASSFSTKTTSVADSGIYTVLATNNAGSATSSPATVTINRRRSPEITLHPDSASLLPGDYVELRAECTDSLATYQWYQDDQPVGDSRSGTVASHIFQASATSGGVYKAVFTNSGGSTTTNTARITVDTVTTRPLITLTPGARTLSYPDGAVSLIGASGRSNATFRWSRDGVAESYNSIGYYRISTPGIYTFQVTAGSESATSDPIIISRRAPQSAPLFNIHPSAISTTANQSISFGAYVEEGVNVTYQWMKDGVAIPGATASSLYITKVSTNDVGAYSVIATNSIGSTTSEAASLTLYPSAYSIEKQPANMVLSAGSSASRYMSVTLLATPSAPVYATYQWRKDGVAIPDATSNSFEFKSVTPAAAGKYSVVATVGSTTLTSIDAVVTVIQRPAGPTITVQPASQTIARTDSATFQVTASGTGTLAYQWRKNGTEIAGATSASFTIPAASVDDSGSYSVQVTDSAASVGSSTATLTVNADSVPVITAQPTARSARTAESTTFSVTASGSPSPTYQWLKNGTPIGGATSATLTLTNLQSNDAGSYAVAVSNRAGSITSDSATLTVVVTPLAAPVITSQPVSLLRPLGSRVTFTGTATGHPAPTLQWYRDNLPITGATAETLEITSFANADVGTYTFVATNSQGSATSQPATLAVGHPAAGSYSGDLVGGGAWAMNVDATGQGVFVAFLAGSGRIVVQTSVAVNVDGTFRAGTEGLTASTPETYYYTGVVSGTITASGLTGQFPGMSIAFTGQKATTTDGAPSAGYYSAVSVVSELLQTHALTTSDGRVFLVYATSQGAGFALGTVTNTGVFTATATNGTYTGTLAPSTHTLRGTFTPTSGSVVTLTTPATSNGNEQLFAISTRGVAGAGDKTMIAGLVVSGTNPKDVMIRAIGPTLDNYGVPDTLRDPSLKLYQNTTLLESNDDWSSGTQASALVSAAARAGAFALATGSKDAALITRLAPGNYTAHVTTSGDTSGVCLIEVYDAGTSQNSTAKMTGLSTRGNVGTGANALIVGLYVNGTAPKKLLIRAVGPTLAPLGVAGTLADPQLELYKGDVLLRTNDDWSTGNDSAAIAQAFSSSGAFALPAGSKDAALLLYLEPGAYTAKAIGASGSTGIAIIEVYEVP